RATRLATQCPTGVVPPLRVEHDPAIEAGGAVRVRGEEQFDARRVQHVAVVLIELDCYVSHDVSPQRSGRGCAMLWVAIVATAEEPAKYMRSPALSLTTRRWPTGRSSTTGSQVSPRLSRTSTSRPSMSGVYAVLPSRRVIGVDRLWIRRAPLAVTSSM